LLREIWWQKGRGYWKWRWGRRCEFDFDIFVGYIFLCKVRLHSCSNIDTPHVLAPYRPTLLLLITITLIMSWCRSI
jgi:hypothetical protein